MLKRKTDMRAPLSIVIPTLNAGDELPGMLAFLIEGLEHGLVRELIVSDGGSDDETVRIAETAGAVVVTGDPGRGGQLRRGGNAASGGWLLFLHADTHLPPGWAAVVRDHIAGSGKAGYFRLGFRSKGAAAAVFAAGANLRSRFGLPYGDQGLLISRELYQKTGGYPDIALMEDVAMVRSLRGHLQVLPHMALTSAKRYRQNGWLKSGMQNLWRQGRFLAGADPAKLARDYDRKDPR